MPGGEGIVLIVEDYRDQANLYAEWLKQDYTTRVTYNGAEGLAKLDEAVDVVLLDRRMPQMTGDAFLEEIRNRGFDCHVAMVTAVEPDFDIVDMGFDAYLVKPVRPEEVRETVQRLLALHDYHELIQEQFALASKLAALRESQSEAALQASSDYQELLTRYDRVNSKAQHQLTELFDGSSDEWVYQQTATDGTSRPQADWGETD